MSDYSELWDFSVSLPSGYKQDISKIFRYEPSFAQKLIGELESQRNLNMAKVLDCFQLAFTLSNIRDRWVVQQRGAEYLQLFTTNYGIYHKAWEYLKKHVRP